MKRKALPLRAALCIFAISAAFAAACAPSVALAGVSSAELPYYTDHVLVVCDDAGKSDASSQAIQDQAVSELQDQGLMVAEVIADASDQSGTVVTADLPEDLSVAEAVEALEGAEGVAGVQPDFIYHTLGTTTNDTLFSSQYYLSSAGFTEAWDSVTCETGASVTVAVVDTGCLLSHEDLKGTVLSDLAWSAADSRPLSSVKNDISSEGHGTHVCGIIAAQANNGKGIAGASYNAKVLPVRVFDRRGDASTSTLLSAFRYLEGLVDSGKLTDLRVINLSLGYYSSSGGSYADKQIEEAIITLREKYNVLCVCAGGNGDENGNPSTDTMYPSDFDASFGVTALNRSGGDASYSDYNMAKDLSAPGSSIKSTGSASSSYVDLSGSSMAAPMVSAAAALMWSANPDLTVDEVQEILKSTATPMTHDSSRAGKTGSAGKLNAAAAVRSVIDSSDLRSIEDASVEMISAVTYTGAAQTPSPEVRIDGSPLTEGVDYVLRYESNIHAGTATIQVIGRGSYRGSQRVHFTIQPVKLRSSQVKLDKSEYAYSGYYVGPEVTVYGLDSKKLSSGAYTVSGACYGKNVGTYTIKVTGEGDYAGTVKRTYVVNPCKTKILRLKRGSRSFTVVVAKKATQVTGYQVQYSTSSKFASSKYARTGSYKTTAKKVLKLKKKKRYYVRVRTYKTVGGKKYYSSWSAVKSVVTS